MTSSFIAERGRRMARIGILFGALAPIPSLNARDLPGDIREGIDAVVAEAYRAASNGLPCKVKGRGKPKIVRWEDVDRCLNGAAARVDWEALARRLGPLRARSRKFAPSEFESAVEASLSAQALAYEQVLVVKDENILLPLTNSVLKFLPAGSLTGLAVSDKAGVRLGTFSGTYTYERTGGLSTANTYRLILFQYTDRSGNVQSAPDKLLLGTYGIPWKEAAPQRGFKLSSERLMTGEQAR